ncbi:MAG: patatin [Actinobacteria bacterium]|nr:MAG: patatin [Actinomycetota bacterium]
MTEPADKRADLVLEGGGVKGIGLVGAILVLTDAGFTFPRVAGTSAGAIVASLLAALQTAGEPPSRLRSFVEQIDYSQFERKDSLQRMNGRLGDVVHLLRHMGLHDGDYLIEWLGGVLDEIGVTTFRQLRISESDDPGMALPEGCRYRLVVHTADITRGKLVRLPWDYPDYGAAPDDQRIVDAVRASMSIPIFFDPVRFPAQAATVGGVAYPAGSVTWVDGGLLSNFPVEVFDRGDGEPERWPTIGIKLSARQTVMPPPQPVHNIAEVLRGCLRSLLANADRYYVDPAKAARTIFVDSGDIKATDFHLTLDAQHVLFQNGERAAHEYLAAAAKA